MNIFPGEFVSATKPKFNLSWEAIYTSKVINYLFRHKYSQNKQMNTKHPFSISFQNHFIAKVTWLQESVPLCQGSL